MTSPDMGALVDAFANPTPEFEDPPLRYRRATVNSVQGGSPATLTLTFIGSSVPVPGVRYPRGSSPAAGDFCEVISAGAASFVVAILA